MFTRSGVDFFFAMAASLAVLGVLRALKIDGQLAVIKNDCYERLAIGQRHNSKDIYKTSNVTTVFECQLFCTEEKYVCKSFSFGIGVKGNTSCELSTDTIKETADLKPIGTEANTDYDLYIKKLGCTLVIDKNNPAFDHYKPQNKPPIDGVDGSSSNKPDIYYNYKPQSGGNKPNSGYDRPSSSDYHKPSSPGYDTKPPHNKPSYNHNTKPTYGYNDKPQEEVQHVQTVVSISSGPQKPILHPYHEILVGEEPYNYARPPFRPSFLHHPYDKPYRPRPDDYDLRPQRPDYGRPNPNFDSRPGESNLMSYGHRPLPDMYGSYIPRPDHYNDYYKPRPDDYYRPNPPSDYNRPRPPADDYSSKPRPPLDDYNSRPRPPPNDYNSKPRPHPDDYNSRPRPPPDDYNSRPRPPVDDYNSGPRPPPDDYNTRPHPPTDDYHRPTRPEYPEKPHRPDRPPDYGRPSLFNNDYNRPKPSSGYDRPNPSYGDYNRPNPSSSSYDGPKPPADSYNRPDPSSNHYDRPNPPSNNYDRPDPPSSNYERPNPSSNNYDRPNPPSNSYDRPNPPSNNYDRPDPPSNNYDRPNPPSNNYNRPNLQSDDYKLSKPTNEYLFNKEVDRYDTRPNKPSESYEKPETVKPNKPNSGYHNSIKGTSKPKDPHNKPIVTQSIGLHGESITSIITELEEACFRRVLAGKRVTRALVKRALFCERVEDCQRECADEKRFACEGFNYRLDPTGRGKGECELLEIPLSHLDIGRDLYPDPEYDYYERDRNSASANCRRQSYYPDSGYDGYYNRRQDQRPYDWWEDDRRQGSRRPRPDHGYDPRPSYGYDEYIPGGNRRGGKYAPTDNIIWDVLCLRV